MPSPDRLAGTLLLVATMPAVAQPAAPPPAVTASDLRHGHTHYLAATGRPNAGLVRLRALGMATGALAGRLYTREGMTEAATAALAGLENVEHANRAWLALAQARLDREAVDAARQALQASATPLYRDFALRRASLLARVQLMQGRPSDAALTLAGERQRQKLPILDRYHLGIARLRAGDIARGLGELEELGLYIGDDPARKALADQANIALGFWYLDHQRGGQARRVFLRVHLDRPLTRRALVGLGWAEISTGGITQALLSESGSDCSVDPELFADAEPLHRVQRPHCRLRELDDDHRLLDAEELQSAEESQYARAATVWEAAARDGDPADPVVAEAMVTHAYAMAALGDQQAAVERFRSIIARLEQVFDHRIPVDDEAAPRTPLAHVAAGLSDARRQLAEQAASLMSALRRAPDKSETMTTLIDALGKVAADPASAPSHRHRGRLPVTLETPGPPPKTVAVSQQRLQHMNERVSELPNRYQTLEGGFDKAIRAAGDRRKQKRRKLIAAFVNDARRGLAALRRVNN